MGLNFLPSRQKIILFGLTFLVFFTQTSGHGNGAPLSRCETMTPGHWISPQTVPSPYQIFVDRENVTEGDRVILTLISADGHDGFKGFLVMVKKAGEDAQNYGQFDLSRSDMGKSQALGCFDREGSAMTHVDNSPKRFVHLEWIAPKVGAGDEEIFEPRATIVQNFWTIWTNLKAQNGIRVLRSPSPSLRKIPGEMAQEVQTRDSMNLPKSDLTEEPQPPQNQNSNANILENAAPGPIPTSPTVVKDKGGEGSWAHFKRSWLQFFQRIGFSS